MPSGGGIGSAIGGIAGGLFGAKAAGDAADAQVAASKEYTEEIERQFDITREDTAPWRQAGTGAVYELADLLGVRVGEAPVAPRREDFMSTQTVDTGRAGPAGFRSTRTEEVFDSESYDRAYGNYLTNLENWERDRPTGELLQPFGLEDFEEDPGYRFRLAEGEKAINRAGAGRVWDSGATVKDLLRYNQGLGSEEYANAFNRDAIEKDRTFNYLSGLSGSGQYSTGQLINSSNQLINNLGNAYAATGNARAAGIVGGANAIQGGISNAVDAYQLDRILDQWRKQPGTI